MNKVNYEKSFNEFKDYIKNCELIVPQGRIEKYIQSLEENKKTDFKSEALLTFLKAVKIFKQLKGRRSLQLKTLKLAEDVMKHDARAIKKMRRSLDIKHEQNIFIAAFGIQYIAYGAVTATTELFEADLINPNLISPQVNDLFKKRNSPNRESGD